MKENQRDHQADGTAQEINIDFDTNLDVFGQ